MTQRNRKLIGIVLILVSIVAWLWVGTALYLALLQGSPWWILIPFFCVIGVGWLYPAMVIIRWMARADE
jgi:hypothetical protein